MRRERSDSRSSRLYATSIDVVAGSRQTHPDKAEVEWVRADLADAASVARALEGAEAAYYLFAHSLGMDDFEQHDRGAARVFASEAGRAGLQQIIYLGGLGDESPDLSPHLRSRAETGRLLAGGPVPLTTLRAAVVIGKGVPRSRRSSRLLSACRR